MKPYLIPFVEADFEVDNIISALMLSHRIIKINEIMFH
jgi:hypothetical protein